MAFIMPKVIALYRYPVKGFTPEPMERITVLPGGRVAGDRVLNFRFADAPVADTAWCRKYHGVVLANTPGLARLNVQLQMLVKSFAQEQPTFGVGMLSAAGGEIRVGDTVVQVLMVKRDT